MIRSSLMRNAGHLTKTLLVCLMLAGVAQAATLTVTTNADTGAGSLRAQVAAAAGGDTIVFQAGLTSPILLTTGEITINKALTITGPGAATLSIDGNNSSRIFNVTDGTGTVLLVTISGLTMTRGRSAGQGGAINNVGENLTIQDCVVSNSTCTGTYGGGVAQQGGQTTLRDSTISGNTANSEGGGIVHIGGSMTITGCTVSGNSGAASGGGGIAVSSGNTLSISNSTFSGNTSTTNGGGIYSQSSVTLTNCTISGNSAANAGSGGGIRLTAGTLTLRSVIVAGNTAAGVANDVSGTAAGASDFNLIGVDTNLAGITNGTNSNQIGTAGTPINPLLGPLQNNGGLTQTRLLLTGSPAIGAGSNPSALSTDQRGTGFPRLVDSAVDIGAVEADATGPMGSLSSAPAVTDASNATQYDFTVTFSDNAAVNVSTLDSTDVRVTGPGAFSALATFVSVDNNTNGTPRVATYRLTPPGGTWDSADNGTYTVALEDSQVRDVSGNNAVAATLGTFTVTRTAPTPPPTVLPKPGEFDTDGDGFSDELEIALGTNFNSSASTPFNGAPAGDGRAFTVKRSGLSIRLNFSGRDTLTLNGSIPAPAGPPLSTAVFDIGGVIEQFTLSSRGRTSKTSADGTQFTLTMKQPRQLGTRNISYSLKVTGALEERLRDEGLTSDAVKKKPVSVIVKVLFNTTFYRRSIPLLYNVANSKGTTSSTP
jgi:predicted outer membrane repeat protein/parallel beta-helix repeat protein